MSALAELVCVHPSDVPNVWPMVAPMVFSAVLRTDLGHTKDIAADVLSGKSQLWLAMSGPNVEAAATTILRRTDRNLVCLLTALGGRDHKRWIALLDRIEEWARTEGAVCLRIYGRKGWLRVLRHYRARHVILEKAL